MKLASRYLASAKIVPPNEFYVKYQKQIMNSLRSPGDRDPSREEITAKKYHYELTSHEVEFYEKMYVPCNRTHHRDDTYLHDLFPDLDLDQLRIGEEDEDLLDFVGVNEPKLLTLVAPVGWGKTVLLKHVWFYLLGRSVTLAKRVIPIYISVDNHINGFGENRNPSEIVASLHELVLRPRLMRIVKPFTKINNDAFWKYLENKTDDFSELSQNEGAIEVMQQVDDRIDRRMQLYELRRQAISNQSFALSATKFMIDTLKKVPVLIFDNVDPLEIGIQRCVLQEAVHLAEDYGIRTIVSMRKRTFDHLAADPDGVIGACDLIEVRLRQRDVRRYLEHRVSVALSAIDPNRLQVEDAKGKRLVINGEPREIISGLIEALLTDEAAYALDFLTYHNLRRLNAYVREYLSTGYIDKHRMIWSLVDKTATGASEYTAPLWVLLSSTLTCNHETHFSKSPSPGARLLNTIVNVYCNGAYSVNQYSIRLHLLNFLERHREVSFDDIVRRYKSLFNNDAPERPILEAAVSRALYRFLHAHMIESPRSYSVAEEKDVASLNPISATDTGSYYRNTLSNYFEYLVYMKDDVDLKVNPYKIKDCIEVRTLAGRYEQVCSFLRHVYEYERAFLEGLDRKQRDIMVGDFSDLESSSPYMCYPAIVAMIAFGEARSVSPPIVNQLRNLLTKIEAHTRMLRPEAE